MKVCVLLHEHVKIMVIEALESLSLTVEYSVHNPMASIIVKNSKPQTFKSAHFTFTMYINHKLYSIVECYALMASGRGKAGYV